MMDSVALWFYLFDSDSESDATDSSEEELESMRVYHRNLRDTNNILDTPDEKFFTTFHVNKEVFRFLLQEMEPNMRQYQRCTHVPTANKLAAFLNFIGRGGFQKNVCNEHITAMSKSQVSRSIYECLDIFQQYLFPKWIKLHKTREEERKTKYEFYMMAGMPSVRGCVDVTHVKIIAPSEEDKEPFWNQKGFCSIKMMVICDYDMTINLVETQPGATPTSLIWDKSSVQEHFKSLEEKDKDGNNWLLGGGNFKLQRHIMTPYRQASRARQLKFNESHVKTHAVAKRCLRVLKNRFKCLTKRLHYTPKIATKIANACCVVHNVCIFLKSDFSFYECDKKFDEENDENELGEVMLDDAPADAITIREEIARSVLQMQTYKRNATQKK